MLKAAWALALAMAATTASAQTMYRCGSVYQDRPCTADAPANKVLRHSGTAEPAPRASLDADCRRAGEDAQKVMWQREAGRTERQQVEAGTASRELIGQVYGRRGSTPEVRAAIETECMQAKERAAQAAALTEAAQRLQAGASAPRVAPAPSPTPTTTSPEANPAAAPAKLNRNDEAAALAERRKSLCTQLTGQLDQLRDRMRTGGSAAQMEEMNRVRRDAEKTQRDAGC